MATGGLPFTPLSLRPDGPGQNVFFSASGHVRIFKSSAGGREQVLSIDGPGSSVAELPVFDGGNYPASVTAVNDATLLFVSKQDFQALCLAHPRVALKVLRVVGARLRQLVGIIEELSFTTVRHRLASFLLRLGRTEGKRTAGGVEVILPVSNQELASQIGTVRELVSRNKSSLLRERRLERTLFPEVAMYPHQFPACCLNCLLIALWLAPELQAEHCCHSALALTASLSTDTGEKPPNPCKNRTARDNTRLDFVKNATLTRAISLQIITGLKIFPVTRCDVRPHRLPSALKDCGHRTSGYAFNNRLREPAD